MKKLSSGFTSRRGRLHRGEEVTVRMAGGAAKILGCCELVYVGKIDMLLNNYINVY